MDELPALYFLMNWLVDGYNVILSDPKLGKLLRGDNESGRREFLYEIARSGKFRGDDLSVIFDGRFAASVSNEAPNLTVRFTTRGETADDFIKRSVARIPKRRLLTVVTNDHAILSYARECGANTMSSTEFLSRIRLRGTIASDSNAASEKPDAVGIADPELLKLFTEKRK